MAFDSDEKPRPLEYPLYNDQGVEVETPDGETADTPFSWQTEDPDERVTITMELSLNEYVALATAVDVGRDIAFNEDSMKIWWIWIRSVNPVSFCEQLINCIENDEDVRAALNGVIAQYNKDHGSPGNLMPAGDQSADWGAGFNPTCDPDIVWSECVKVVERCNTAIVDLFESISEADTIAKITGVLASLPVIENVGLSSLTDLATLLIELSLTAYNDAYTTEWAETLECAVFCAAKEDCVVNFIKVWNILRPRVEDEIVGFVPPGNFLDMAEWATAIINFTTELLALDKADLLFYLIFGGLAYGNVILNQNNIGAGILEIAVILASDEPSNDWEVLCEECPSGWTVEFPDDQPFSLFTPLTYSGAVTTLDTDGIYGHTDTGGTAVFLNFDIELTGDVDHIEFDVEYQYATPYQEFQLHDESGLIDTFILNTSSPVTIPFDFTRTGTHTYSVLAGVQGTEAGGAYLRVVGMRWSGTGTNPFM